MPKDDEAPALLALGVVPHGFQPLARIAALVVREILEQPRRHYHVSCAVEKKAVRGQSVATCPSDLLIIILHALGQVRMYYEAHVGLVYPHPESYRGHHHEYVVAHERGLVGVALLGGKAGMISGCGDSAGAEGLGEIVGTLPGTAIDYTRLAAARLHELDDAPARILLGLDGNAKVGPVEAAEENLRILE